MLARLRPGRRSSCADTTSGGRRGRTQYSDAHERPRSCEPRSRTGVDGAWKRWITGLRPICSEGDASFGRVDLTGGSLGGGLAGVHPCAAYRLRDGVRG